MIKDRSLRWLPTGTPDEIEHARNRMSEGNYPLSTTDCEVIGIQGNCGNNCPIYKQGKCEHHD